MNPLKDTFDEPETFVRHFLSEESEMAAIT